MELSSRSNHIIRNMYQLLKLTYGLLFVVAGADKFFNLITIWQKYVGPLAIQIVPVPLNQFMLGVGILEIIIGLLILFNFTRIGSLLAAIWLLLISANLLSTGGYFDIAVRDIVMAIGAFVLTRLTTVYEEIVR